MAEVVTAWLASLEGSGIRPVTIRGYASAVRPVVDKIGTRRVASLTPTDVRATLTWVRDHGSIKPAGGPLSNSSVQYARLGLRMALGYAVEQGVLDANPARDVKNPKRKGEQRKETATWTPAQLTAFIEVADTVTIPVAWRLVGCGLRRSEVCGLDWENVDLAAGTIRVAASRVAAPGGKTEQDAVKSDSSARTVPVDMIQAGTLALLREAHMAAGRPDTGAVVVDADGRPAHPTC